MRPSALLTPSRRTSLAGQCSSRVCRSLAVRVRRTRLSMVGFQRAVKKTTLTWKCHAPSRISPTHCSRLHCCHLILDATRDRFIVANTRSIPAAAHAFPVAQCVGSVPLPSAICRQSPTSASYSTSRYSRTWSYATCNNFWHLYSSSNAP